jgi:hypothetical protein
MWLAVVTWVLAWWAVCASLKAMASRDTEDAWAACWALALTHVACFVPVVFSGTWWMGLGWGVSMATTGRLMGHVRRRERESSPFGAWPPELPRAVARLSVLAAALAGCVYEVDVTPTPAPEGDRVAVEIPGELVWTKDECIEEDDGDCTKGGYHTHTKDIYLVDRGEIWRSLLTHELIHYYLDLDGDGDGGHTRSDWWGMVDEVDEEIRAWEDSARCQTTRRR